jgi:hypothetical protein
LVLQPVTVLRSTTAKEEWIRQTEGKKCVDTSMSIGCQDVKQQGLQQSSGRNNRSSWLFLPLLNFDYVLVFVALKRCDFKIGQAFRLTIDDFKYETVQAIMSISIAVHTGIAKFEDAMTRSTASSMQPQTTQHPSQLD